MITKPLTMSSGKPTKATITIAAEELADSRSYLELQFSAEVPKKGMFAKPDPFVEICRQNEANAFVSVHRTEKISSTTTPVWGTFFGILS